MTIRISVAFGSHTMAVALGVFFCVATFTVFDGFGADADLDPSFDDDGRLAVSIAGTTGTSGANAIAVQPDGKIVLGGTVSAGTAGYDFAFARVEPAGDLDPTFHFDGKANFDPFGTGLDDYIYDIAVQPDGKIVGVGGTVSGSNHLMMVVRLNANGGVDGYRQVPFSGDSWAYGVALQPDGKIVVSGLTTYANSGADFAVARLNTDLTMDTTFNSDGMTDWDFGEEGYDCAFDVAVRSDGKIVLAGTAFHGGQSVFGVMVYSATGAPQGLGWSNFAEEAFGEGLALQPDGKAVVTGGCNSNSGDFAVVRFNTNATLDTTFNGDGMATFSFSAVNEEFGNDVAIQHDGKIVVAGHLFESGVERFAVVRWNGDGSLDYSLNPSPPAAYTYTSHYVGHNSQGNGIFIQPDGKLVVGGWTNAPIGDLMEVARFRGDEDLIFYGGFESGSTDWWGDWGP